MFVEPARIEVQSAYRILVASSEEVLRADVGDKWGQSLGWSPCRRSTSRWEQSGGLRPSCIG